MSQSAITAAVSSSSDAAGISSQSEQARRRSKTLRVPLHVLAALSVAILLLVTVGALGGQTYRGVQEILSTAALEETHFISEALGKKVESILEPAESQLTLLAHSDLPAAGTLANRLSELPLFLEALKRNTLIDASFVGYPNGEFILFRPLRNAEARTFFDAPAESTLLVQSVSQDAAGVMLGLYQFFDANGRVLDSAFKNDYRFDPRTRPWYMEVGRDDASILTGPYPFFTTQKVGATMARRSADGRAVVGLDFTLQSLAEALDGLAITPSTEIAVIDAEQHVIGYRDAAKMIVTDELGGLRLATIDELNVPVLAGAFSALAGGAERGELEIDGRGWQVMRAAIPGRTAHNFTLLAAIPDDELFVAARRIVERQAIVGLVIVLAAIAIGWWGARLLTRSLHLLVKETKLIRSFDFRRDTKVPTILTEVENLSQALDTMKGTIRKFLDIGNALSAERDLGALLERVLRESVRLAGGDGGVVYLVDKEGAHLEPEIARWQGKHMLDEQIILPRLSLNSPALVPEIVAALAQGEIMVAKRNLTEAELEALGMRYGMTATGAARVGLVAVPLFNRKREPLGALLLIKTLGVNDRWSVNPRLRELIRAVSGSAGIAIENHQLLQAQKDLMNALIKLIAGAIDAKSAYTGGHCQRVPVLTRMLAEAACAQKEGPFKDFQLSEEEWEAVDIASWLHDCGKVTTPEYVVDKATKLETIHDRIHEIRMRFEVLKRDVEIAYWQTVAKGGDADALHERMEAELRALDEDFAFVAECNEGGEVMDPERIERLKRIAARTWRRTLDDRLGVSFEERERKNRSAASDLPVEEKLLADREDHITYRAPHEIIGRENPWGIRVETPTYKFNRGEIYNLSIGRGTLTPEERYIINDHMTQTIMMLESLPLPRHLRNVPEIAGGHHEKMNGKGYPKRLTRDQMSPVARMMAIADVFEALTAADRPYKKAKTLSEAIRIMANMKRDHHLDPDLLDLFLTSGVWKNYAHRFLDVAQIDEPDVDAVLKTQPA
ncbi:HD domain-containing phosphohydrolase [Dongia deserti]|uniref:HD domain-containing phosphohydrolase n=1 Tax=Dongia deserti TaxID=2268030 RepID=UPI000E64A4D1|nr:HD domain-containing phosphohydrolase [Dongia deserti]